MVGSGGVVLAAVVVVVVVVMLLQPFPPLHKNKSVLGVDEKLKLKRKSRRKWKCARKTKKSLILGRHKVRRKNVVRRTMLHTYSCFWPFCRSPAFAQLLRWRWCWQLRRLRI